MQPLPSSPTASPDRTQGAPKRYALLRNFSLASLICTALAAAALGFLYRHQAVNELIAEAQFDNAALAGVLSYTLREDVATLLRHTGTPGAEASLGRIDKAVRHQARAFRAAKVKIYSPDGLVVYSSRPEEIGTRSQNNLGVTNGMAGRVTTSLVHRDQFNTFDQVVENRDLLQTYLPVREQDGSEVSGVFELYSDMTGLLARIRGTERVVMASVVGTMLVLYCLLLLVVRRADRTIRRQDEILADQMREIARHNVDLEDRVRDRTAALQAQIEEREASERELALTRERAWEQEKLATMGRLAAGIVHEFGNPLAAVRGLADSTAEAIRREKVREATQALEQLDRQVGRLESITRDVSAFAVPDLPEPELLNLNELLTRVSSTTGYDVRLREIEISLALAPDLPAVMGTVGQLWQVFVNLIVNAAEAIARRPGAAPRIIVRSARGGDEAVISIEDGGDGMEPEQVAMAFEPFHTTKPAGQGMGIGLSYSHSIVQRHGGAIEIDSRRGQGTTVRIRLPLAAI